MRVSVLRLELNKTAADFITQLQAKQVWNKIVALMKDPRPADSSELHGYAGYFRATSGEYRIVYRIERIFLKIILVDKRNDDEIYKRLRNLF
jgi:mRNA interferase RelE/StbE